MCTHVGSMAWAVPVPSFMGGCLTLSRLVFEHGVPCHAEFMRVPDRTENPMACVKGVTALFDPHELTHGSPVPLGAQLMGSNVELLELAAHVLAVRGNSIFRAHCTSDMCLLKRGFVFL